MSYLKDLVENKVLDYVYHEHLAHHSVAPLKQFFESIGMQLFDVEHVNTKGGSIRGFASLVDSSWQDSGSVELFIQNELEMGLYNADVYYELTDYVSQLKKPDQCRVTQRDGKGSPYCILWSIGNQYCSPQAPRN